MNEMMLWLRKSVTNRFLLPFGELAEGRECKYVLTNVGMR